MYGFAFLDGFALEVMAFNCIGYLLSGEKVLVYGYSKTNKKYMFVLYFLLEMFI